MNNGGKLTGAPVRRLYAQAFLAFIAALVLYLVTLAPVVTFVDSGELAAAIATGGVSHPSGSPLYMVLGSVVALIPAGSLIWRLNAFSAVAAAGCVAFTYFLLQRRFEERVRPAPAQAKVRKKKKEKDSGEVPKQPGARMIHGAGAAAAAIALACNRALWSTATVTEVYALHAFLIALLALLLLRHVEEVVVNPRSPRIRWLALAAFAAGLGASNYPPYAIVGPAVIVVLWRYEGAGFVTRWKRTAIVVACFCAGLLPYVLIPLRAASDPLINWGNPSDWERFWNHISAKQYSVFLGSPRLSVLPAALSLWWTQWPAAVWLLILPGFFYLRRARPALFLFTAVLGLTNVVYVLAYDITDVSSAPSDYYVYLLALCWCSAVWIGAGICWVLEWLEGSRFHAAAAVVLALFPAVAIPLHWQQMDRSQYTYADDFTRSILSALAPNALVLSPDWTFVSPAMYLQHAEGVRPDVTVLDGELLRRSWYFPYLQKRAPQLYSACEPQIRAFLVELAKYEKGLPYDGNVITERYVGMLNGLLEQGLKQDMPPYILLNLQAKEADEQAYVAMEQALGRPPYVTTGVMPQAIGGGFQWVPETPAFRLYADGRLRALPDAAIPPRSIDSNRDYDNVTRGVIVRYADFWRYRGDYLRKAGNCSGARSAYERSLTMADLPEARAGINACP